MRRDPFPDRSLLRRRLCFSIPECLKESQVAIPPGVRVRSWSFLDQRLHDGLVSSFRAPVERAVATLKTWRILFTDYRRPLKTFKSSFRAAIGLYFFKEGFA